MGGRRWRGPGTLTVWIEHAPSPVTLTVTRFREDHAERSFEWEEPPGHESFIGGHILAWRYVPTDED